MQGKVLLVPAEDPAFVITDPGWFVRILSMLPVEAGSGTQGFLEFVSKDTPLWTPKELLTVSTQKLSKEKVSDFFFDGKTKRRRKKIYLKYIFLP